MIADSVAVCVGIRCTICVIPAEEGETLTGRYIKLVVLCTVVNILIMRNDFLIS